ncbi:phage tail tape measure protein [Stappia sp. F7233]|uniref:Phage tail tape measure protein n=1 Tax=Stappia albiluteola TaxID=2758565 RepID=A0A839AM44_9HYPH|nr:phage tail length tape measure family protein [Stappia albiluteola]MBA5779499.1 phage tail tape measure protein [Stappia albiluteola]
MPGENTEKLVLLYEAQNRDVIRKLDQIERASKRAFDNSRTPLRRFSRELEKTQRPAEKLRTLFSQSSRSVAVLEGPLGGVAGRLTAVASAVGSVNPLLTTAGVLLAGFTAAAVKAVPAFARFETQQLTLQQVLRATGGSAGRTARQLEELAQSVGFNTLGSTSEAREAAAQLLTFRSIANDAFDRTLRLAQDLATVGFGTLSSSTVQLGKALEDPVNGLSALRRVGVSFTEAQKDLIRNFSETGRVAEAQNVILDAVEQQVGGAGAASGQGLAGAYDTLSEATQILLERWGRQIAAATSLKSGILGIAGAIDEVNFRAGLGGQLQTVDDNISLARRNILTEREFAGTRPPGANVVAQEEERLQGLLRYRAQLLRELDRQRKEEDDAYVRSIEQQKAAELERIDTVVAGLQKEIDLSKQSADERRIAAELAKAGVTADSDAGKRIEALTREAIAADKAAEARAKLDREGERQKETYQRVVDALNLEFEAIGKTAEQQRIMNELSRAGVATGTEEADIIEEKVKAIYRLNAEQERFNEIAQFAGDQITGVFSDLISGASSFEDSLRRVAASISDVVLQATLLGQGPLAELFGTSPSGGNAVGGLLGAIFDGFRADGGPVSSGRAYVVGERGPELFVPKSAGQIIPNGAGSGGMVFAPVYNIDARGSQMRAGEFRAIIEENNRQIVPQIAVSAVGRANRKSVSPAFRGR